MSAATKAARIAQMRGNHVRWSNDLTDAQLRMVMQSGDHDGASGYGVEINGGQWAAARSLVKAGLGWIEGGKPNGSSLPGLYFNNRDGVEITHEFDEDETDWGAEGRRIALDGMGLPDGAHFGMADELGIEP